LFLGPVRLSSTRGGGYCGDALNFDQLRHIYLPHCVIDIVLQPIATIKLHKRQIRY
jgi:hypothetical protein